MKLIIIYRLDVGDGDRQSSDLLIIRHNGTQ